MARASAPKGRSALSHVEERLRHRALPAAADRGFTLLRSRERLRGLLARASERDPRLASFERLAIPLAPGPSPARLIVSRDGVGVTCLAADMVASVPDVPWSLVESFLDEEGRLFRAQVEVQRSEGEAPVNTPLGRAFRFPWRITRAEMEVLETLAPLVTDLAKESVIYAADALGVLRAKRVALTDESAGSLWQLYTGAAIWLLAARREPDAVPLAYALIANARDVHLAARALWILVGDPDRTFEQSPEIVRGREVLVGAACRYVLPAIALRHPARARDAALQARALLAESPIADVEEVEAAIRSLEDGREALAPLVDEHLSRAPADLEGWDPLSSIGAPPASHARAGSALDDEERRSLMAWRRVLHARDLPLLLPDDPFFPLLAALVPLEALLPLDEPDPAWRRAEGVAYVKGPLSRMVRVTTLADLERAPQRKAGRDVGRNDPCPCGSGRKFKHCHGKV